MEQWQMLKIRVLYPLGDTHRYTGSTATKIVMGLWRRHPDFTKSKNVDEWIKAMSRYGGINPKGDTTEKRCENYLRQFQKRGYGILVTKGSKLDKKLNQLRLQTEI